MHFLCLRFVHILVTFHLHTTPLTTHYVYARIINVRVMCIVTQKRSFNTSLLSDASTCLYFTTYL